MNSLILEGYSVTDDVEKKFKDVWSDLLLGQTLSTSNNPKIVLLGGQPGAGKAFGSKKVIDELNGNVLVINGDDYRHYHSRYEDIYKVHNKEASKYTGDFAGLMVSKVRDEAIKHRFNVIIEGTFRTIETPLKELNKFKENAYCTEVIICTCPKDISWQSTIERGDKDLKAGGIPRYTPKEHHDLVVACLAKNVDAIVKTRLVNRLRVFNREKMLFDSVLDTQQMPSDVIEVELNRTYINT
ncbi:zeta toxin family protein [Pelistega ratti]|uniref:zeta toxin family protein n=1 Tax=Pelistega ratti TaxID=2652177 RepID=UPI00135C1B70|nr:zeta toxin family protein [Pelistega ratti]